MEIQIKIIGFLLIVLSLIHGIFPKYFNWKEELRPLSLINKQLMTVHTFFIAFVVFLFGVLCLTSAAELTQTKFGKTISFGLGLFWATRLFFQLFIFSPRLWMGKVFETTVHILFVFIWIYLSVVFFWAAMQNS